MNLNVIFLTLRCEDIPAKIHESVAMQDVYVLLEKSKEDNLAVTEDLREKSLAIEENTRIVLALKEQMEVSFNAVTSMLRKTHEQQIAANNVSSAVVDNNNTMNDPISFEPLAVSHTPTSSSDVTTATLPVVVTGAAEVNRSVNMPDTQFNANNPIHASQAVGIRMNEINKGESTVELPLVGSIYGS